MICHHLLLVPESYSDELQFRGILAGFNNFEPPPMAKQEPPVSRKGDADIKGCKTYGWSQQENRSSEAYYQSEQSTGGGSQAQRHEANIITSGC